MLKPFTTDILFSLAADKKVLNLLKDINKKYGMSIILITHDFGAAKYLCNRLLIMYGGLVVEEGNIDDVLGAPLHPYTSALIKCSASLEKSDDFLYTIDGSPLTPYNFKNECPFHFRCEHANPDCIRAIPEITVTNNRKVRCILHKEGKTL
jgi:oligopeptide/dipeptide ABC transporter ATP-binding protein